MELDGPYGIDERKLGKNVKVRNHSGAVIEDMFDHVNAVLRRKPSAIILHVGTNNSPQQDYVTIVEKIVSLRQYINSKLPSCKVIYSSMFLRKDNVMANDNLQRANSLLKEIYTNLIDNDNIADIHLGKKGLHLNDRGVGRFALNLISYIRCL